MKQTVIYTFLFALALCGGAFFLLKDQRTGSHNVVIMPHLTPPLATPVATPWISPDGSKTLVMKTTIGADARKTYSFSVQESPSLGEHLVYSKTLDVGDEMSIPFNSWSPNNQYFFIQEKGKDGEHILVLKASGASFPDGNIFIDVNSAYVEKKIPYAFEQVTGWAAPTLLVVNTKSPTSSAPISFWFDISKKSFIRLSTSFQ